MGKHQMVLATTAAKLENLGIFGDDLYDALVQIMGKCAVAKLNECVLMPGVCPAMVDDCTDLPERQRKNRVFLSGDERMVDPPYK